MAWFKKSEARKRAQAIATVADFIARFCDQGWRLTRKDLEGHAPMCGVPKGLALSIAQWIETGSGGDYVVSNSGLLGFMSGTTFTFNYGDSDKESE